METRFQTSFIPKKPGTSSEVYKYHAPLGPFLIISIIIVALSVILAGGTVVYRSVLNRQLDKKAAELEERSAKIPTDKIDSIVRFADKLDSADKLLNNHLALSTLFKVLEGETLKKIQFSDFQFNNLTGSKMAITMKGTAPNFKVVARQQETFSEIAGTKFLSPIFSDLSLDQNQNAHFTFFTVVDTNLLLYKNNLPTNQ